MVASSRSCSSGGWLIGSVQAGMRAPGVGDPQQPSPCDRRLSGGSGASLPVNYPVRVRSDGRGSRDNFESDSGRCETWYREKPAQSVEGRLSPSSARIDGRQGGEDVLEPLE